MRSPFGLSCLLVFAALVRPAAGDEPRLPAAAEGWFIRLGARAPEDFLPSAVVAGRTGDLFVGGTTLGAPPAAGAVIRVEGAGISTFAHGLGPVVALERGGDVLYVVHGAALSALRDLDGDGRAEDRVDLLSGLGDPNASFGGDVRGVAAIIRGMDGFLYLAIGDVGLSRAEGKGGRKLQMHGGGVIRVRLDGTDLQLVTEGDARAGGMALSAADDVLSFSDTEESRWGLRLIHHVAGGRYGYPYQFATAEFRSLPATAKLQAGRAGQAAFSDRTRAGAETMLQCDPESGTVYGQTLRKVGGGFALENRTPVVERGPVADFRPRAITSSGADFWMVDSGPVPSGGARIYRLSPRRAEDEDPVTSPRSAETIDDLITTLDDPRRSVRLDAEDRLVANGPSSVAKLIGRLGSAEPSVGRLHALWALDRIGTADARGAIRARLIDSAAPIRLQAARSSGLRGDRMACDVLAKLLVDRDPAVRREAAIALGRIGDRSAVPALLAALGDSDRFAAWSIRRAILELGCDDREALTAAFLDPHRREAALLLADESWSVPIVEALVDSLGKTPEAVVRGRMLSCLATQYYRYPERNGEWFGPNPLSGPLPKKTVAWDPRGMSSVLAGLERGIRDPDASVRYQAVFGLQGIGTPAAAILRDALPREPDEDNQAALVEALGAMNDAASTRLLLPIVVDTKRPEPVRSAALDALGRLRGRDVVRARLTILYEEGAPESLVAKALPSLARDGFLPPNDLADFLHHASPLIRAAAVMSLSPARPLPADVKEVVLARLDDEDSDVRRAAFLAAGPLKLREAVPKLVEKATKATDDDRTAVLAALCSLADPRALPLYVETLDDPDPSLRRGALAALTQVRDRAEPALRKLAAEGGRSPEAAAALERVLSRFEVVLGWKVLGPVATLPQGWMAPDGTVDVSRTYPTAGGGPVAWGLASETEEGVVDLPSPQSPAAGGATAACTEISSREARRAILVVEADGPVSVFLNGRPLQSAEAPEGHGQYSASLAAGSNHIAVINRLGAPTRRFAILVSEPGVPASR